MNPLPGPNIPSRYEYFEAKSALYTLVDEVRTSILSTELAFPIPNF